MRTDPYALPTWPFFSEDSGHLAERSLRVQLVAVDEPARGTWRAIAKAAMRGAIHDGILGGMLACGLSMLITIVPSDNWLLRAFGPQVVFTAAGVVVGMVLGGISVAAYEIGLVAWNLFWRRPHARQN
jgi:hypothetical protein